jgi:Ca-activated chloride channel family protein
VTLLVLELARPYALTLGVLGLLAALLVFVGARRSSRAALRVLPARLATQLDPRRRARTRSVCIGAALLLCSAALAGPVVGASERPVLRRGVDLVVCIDTSRSMLARDAKPTRFERAKREITLLLDELGGDRVSLVAFSGDARSVAPLTRDGAALGDLLESLSMEDARLGGTDLAVAIDFSLTLFEERSGKHEAIVLLTDGEDLSGQGLAAAERAADKGIRVYVVGVGSVRGAKIPIADPSGDESFLRGPDGEEVVSRLGEESLERLAVATGGAYTSTERSARPLVDLVRGPIASLERRETEQGSGRVPHDRYQWPLFGALVLVAVERLLAATRGAGATS